MRTMNTIPPEEDAKRLAEACAQLRKALINRVWDNESLIREAEDKGDEDEYLTHKYWGRALDIAIDALTKSPEQFMKHKNEIITIFK